MVLKYMLPIRKKVKSTSIAEGAMISLTFNIPSANTCAGVFSPGTPCCCFLGFGLSENIVKRFSPILFLYDGGVYNRRRVIIYSCSDPLSMDGCGIINIEI